MKFFSDPESKHLHIYTRNSDKAALAFIWRSASGHLVNVVSVVVHILGQLGIVLHSAPEDNICSL